MKHIKASWERYRDVVISTNASKNQFIECERAFYAGAWSFYAAIMNNLEGGQNETPKDLQLMENLHNELVEYGRELNRERDMRN